jgi:integrase
MQYLTTRAVTSKPRRYARLDRPRQQTSCTSALLAMRAERDFSSADSGYIAVNEAGEPYTPGALTNMWHRLTAAAGVRSIRLHDARHSCGTALHLRGVPMAVIAKWLGHADASITARIYAHSQDDALKAAGTTLGQIVASD